MSRCFSLPDGSAHVVLLQAVVHLMRGIALGPQAVVNGTKTAVCTTKHASAFWLQHHLSGNSTMPRLAAKHLSLRSVLIDAVAQERGITVVWLPTWQWYAWRYGPYHIESDGDISSGAGGHWVADGDESDNKPPLATELGGDGSGESDAEPWLQADSGSDSDEYDVQDAPLRDESHSGMSRSRGMAPNDGVASASEQPEASAAVGRTSLADTPYEYAMHADVVAQMRRDLETALQPFL